MTCPASVVYSGAALEPCSVSVTGAGGLSLSPTPTYSANTNVGTAGASYTYAGDANHFGSSDSTTFAITPKALTITAADVSKTFGATYVLDTTTPSTDFSVVGLVSGESITSVTLTSAGAAAGATVAGSPYPIVPSAAVAALGTDLGNYTSSYVDGALTVTDHVEPPPPPAPETTTQVRVETAADGSGTVLPAQNLAAGSSVTGYAITRHSDGTFAGNVPARWTLTSITGGVVGGDLVPSADARSARFTGHLAGTAKLRADDGSHAGESGTITVVAGDPTGPAANGRLADVAASDAHFNHVVGFDVRFASSGSSTRLVATNPGTFHYELDLRNETGVTMPVRGRPLPSATRNGVSIADGSGLSTVVIVTVPSLPASTGLAAVPGSTRTPGSPRWAQLPENPAFVVAGSRSVRVNIDGAGGDVDVTVSWAASAPGGNCLATSGIAWVSGQPPNNAFVKCIRIEGFEIPAGQAAHVRVGFRFGLAGTSGWERNAAAAFRAGFAFRSQTRVTLGAELATASVAGPTYVGTNVAGLSGAGQRTTAVGGFVFGRGGAGIRNARVRLCVAHTAARRCSGADWVAETTTNADGFYFIWKRGADQSVAGPFGLPSGMRTYVAVWDGVGGPWPGAPGRWIRNALSYAQFEAVNFFVSDR